MGKSRKSTSKGSSETSSANPRSSPSTPRGGRSETDNVKRINWGLPRSLVKEYVGAKWAIGFMVLGLYVGFAMGSGWVGALMGQPVIVTPWKQQLANRIRSNTFFQIVTLRGKIWEDWLDSFSEWAQDLERDLETEEYAQNPSHPRVFAVLREAVIREKGGYVHHDLGLLVPAPSGASRGIGMVKDSYHKCQTKCLPGTADEKLEWKKLLAEKAENETIPIPDTAVYHQEEVLIKVPLTFQMTRSVALDTLLTLVPAEVQQKASLYELDDAALLVLLLAHERGVGRFSRWLPYIASLPLEPSCGYSKSLRPYMLDMLDALRNELGVDVEGWDEELLKATQYADRIAEGLNKDYGEYLQTPPGKTSLENIAWALCQVSSRATAGTEKHGSLRMVPILDMVNHDSNAGGFIELTGKERLESGDFVDATETDSGTFVIRSLRHGRRRPLRKGQELLANYNVPQYTPLDWLISLGFVPPERWARWEKVDPVLPRVRHDGPFAEEGIPTEQVWKEQSEALLQHLKRSEL